MSAKLKEFISALRECKTQKEEKELMLKERSRIQESLLKNKHELRPRNLVKLLFINLQGLDTEFGQMESLNIISRASFLEKKVGYLTLSLFIHEKSDMLMMATNRLGMDMDCPHLFIKALALTCFAAISDADMCRSLSSKIVKLSAGDFPRPRSKSPFLARAFSLSRKKKNSNDEFFRTKGAQDLRVLNVQKKALLAAMRVCQKCPELKSDYYESIRKVVQQNEHGVLISAMPLLKLVADGIISGREEAGGISEEGLDLIVKVVPLLVKKLQTLLRENDAEYEVAKFNDPFLCIGILDFFKEVVVGVESLQSPSKGEFIYFYNFEAKLFGKFR